MTGVSEIRVALLLLALLFPSWAAARESASSARSGPIPNGFLRGITDGVHCKSIAEPTPSMVTIPPLRKSVGPLERTAYREIGTRVHRGGAAPMANLRPAFARQRPLGTLNPRTPERTQYAMRMADPIFRSRVAAASSTAARPSFLERLKNRVYVSGTAQLRAAYETEDGEGQKFEFILQPEIEVELPYNIDLTIIPRVRADLYDDLEPDHPDQDSISDISKRLFLGNHVDVELREFYIETVVRNVYLTIGKQQVVWGKADGLRVLDVVNPFDFREFIFDDFDQARIPLWMVNAEIPVGEATLQLLWIPDLTYHQLPEEGATFEFKSNVPQPPPGIPVIRNDVDKPDNVITDSDVGARLSWFWKGWDLSLNYLYHYDDVPVLYRTIKIGPTGPFIVSNPGYERTHLLGGTFSNAFGDLTVRGEFGYSLDKYYSTINPLDVDGVHKTDEFSYVLGFDWFGISDTFLSLQFFQSILREDATGLLRDRVENNVSFLLRRDFMNDTLVFENITVHSLNHSDGFNRTKLKYALRDDLDVWAGVDVIYGDKSGLFGQFEDKSRVIFGMELSF